MFAHKTYIGKNRNIILLVTDKKILFFNLWLLKICLQAWIGFSYGTDPESTSLNYPGVATGNWGCGAFGGSPELKSLIQMMACAQANRPMAYYTFKDNEIRDDVIGVYNLLARYNVTVGKSNMAYVTNQVSYRWVTLKPSMNN